MRTHSLNRAQRLVIVVGVAVALVVLGEWLTSLGSKLNYGWVAYAPLSNSNASLNGLHLWVRMVIWLVLVVVWVLVSLVLLRSTTSNHDAPE